MASNEDQMSSNIPESEKLNFLNQNITAQESPSDVQRATGIPSMGAGSAKAEKNKRKKENARINKADAISRQLEDTKLFEEMIALSVQRWEKMDLVNGHVTKMSQAEEKNVHVPTVPSNLSFEFRACPEKKGIGAFARTDIEEGTEILVEEAILKGPSANVFQASLFKVVPKDKQDKINALLSRCHCKSLPCVETPLTKTWIVNSFGSRDNSLLYDLASRFNHGCRPNLARGFTKDDFIVFRAAKNIQKGEELFINYRFTRGSARERQEDIFHSSGFFCTCLECKKDRWLPQDIIEEAFMRGNVKTTTPVVGLHTSEERAAYAEVKAWFDSYEVSRIRVEKKVFDLLGLQTDLGDKKGREKFAKQAAMTFQLHLKQNNKYGLDDTFFHAHLQQEIGKWIRNVEEKEPGRLQC